MNASSAHRRRGARQGRLGACLAASMVATTVASVSPALLLAAEPVVAFENEEQRARYDRMLEEYRCLKCQNQNLAGSNAALAGDLRREIRDQILEGADDSTIDRYLVDRYGDFVRYRPRFGGINLVLWIGPFVLLGIGLVTGVVMARRSQRRAAAAAPTDAASVARARELLDARNS